MTTEMPHAMTSVSATRSRGVTESTRGQAACEGGDVVWCLAARDAAACRALHASARASPPDSGQRRGSFVRERAVKASPTSTQEAWPLRRARSASLHARGCWLPPCAPVPRRRCCWMRVTVVGVSGRPQNAEHRSHRASGLGAVQVACRKRVARGTACRETTTPSGRGASSRL